MFGKIHNSEMMCNTFKVFAYELFKKFAFLIVYIFHFSYKSDGNNRQSFDMSDCFLILSGQKQI